MTTGIVITAAGRGERFYSGRRPWQQIERRICRRGGRAAIAVRTHPARALASGLPVQVVTRPDNLPVLAACAANQVPVTLLASAGLGDSIAAGVAATPHWQGWLIHPPICRSSAPRFSGRWRTPYGSTRSCAPAMRNSPVTRSAFPPYCATPLPTARR